MSKEKYNRLNVKSTILKRVVIRVDFIGLTDIEGCVSSLKKIMNEKFQRLTPISNKNYNVELPDQFSQHQIPNVNFERTTFYRFSESLMGSDNANFMLGTDFAYLEVNCGSDYAGCDKYIRLMAESINCILHFDPFISIKRLGLKKIDVAEFDNIQDMDNAVETPIWNNYKQGDAFIPLKKSYSDLLLQQDVRTVFNIQRQVQAVENGNRARWVYVFDVDSFKNGSLINPDDFASVANIEKVISEQMNMPLFNYFIETFTEQYIDQFYHE